MFALQFAKLLISAQLPDLTHRSRSLWELVDCIVAGTKSTKENQILQSARMVPVAVRDLPITLELWAELGLMTHVGLA